MKNVSSSLSRVIPGLSLFMALILLLSACGGSGNSGAVRSGTPGGGGGSGSITPTLSVTPAIQLGPQPCPASVKDAAHWDAIIPTQPNVTQVGRVICGYLAGKPTLQALVNVYHAGTGQVLDIYVYDNITAPGPTQLFKLTGLYKGDARISNYNTIVTAEVDQDSSVNKGKPNAALIPDLFREFNTGTFARVSFPGIYPDLTRYQAEHDQAQVNQGQDAWKLDATQVATHFAGNSQLLNWTNSMPTLVSGGGSNDAGAVVRVKVKDSSPAGAGVTLTMQRLEGNTNGGIWEIVAVNSDGMSITSPKNRDALISPVTVSGTGNAFEGVIGPVMVLDHTYTSIGHATAMGTGNGPTTFSVNVPFTPTFKNGAEDGIVVLYATNNANGSYTGAMMLKELL